MATLQKIRSKGPLLLIVIGLAMLAFILGDAWKIIKPNQNVQFVGSIDGKNISAMDFQDELENYTEVVKFGMGTNDLTEEMNNSLKDEVWSTMVRNTILNNEAAKLGLAVTDAEVRDVIEKGTDPILANTPFSNAQGQFDADNLKNFIAGYESLDRSAVPAEEMRYYDSMYKFWLYIEKEIKSSLLYKKYSSLVGAAIISNPVAAKNSYENRISRADVLMASLPFSSLSDDDVTISAQDFKNTYNENKEKLFNYAETRDIYYIDYEIQPSQADRDALLAEMTDLTSQLEQQADDYASFVRRSLSKQQFSEVGRSLDFLPAMVAANIDSVNADGMFGPVYNAANDSYTSFKLISTANGYDSIQFSLMQVAAETQEETDRIADSVCTAVKGGADFAEIAAVYGQSGTEQWIASDQYEGAVINGDNAKYLNAINSMKKGEVAIVPVNGGSLVINVSDVRNTVKKYVVATIERPVEFSEETANKAYTDLSLFVAQNATLESLKENAEDSDYRLLYYPGFSSSSNYVGGVAKSHEALRWAFDASENEVSRIFEVGQANDHLLVVAVSKINEAGYTSVENAKTALASVVLNNKKAEVLMDKLAKAKTMEEAMAIDGVKIDTVQFCNFTNNAYISSLMSNEPTVGPSVMNLEENVLTAPQKGQGCVFVAKKISAESYSAEFDENAEVERLKALGTSQISQSLLQELYMRANVVDTRYRIF